jgi:hypothetical protein
LFIYFNLPPVAVANKAQKIAEQQQPQPRSCLSHGCGHSQEVERKNNINQQERTTGYDTT